MMRQELRKKNQPDILKNQPDIPIEIFATI